MTPGFQQTTIDGLSEEQRLRRIAEILFDAVLLANNDAALAAESGGPEEVSSPAMPQVLPQQLPADEQRIVDYLSRVGEAPPLALRTVLGLPRTSTYRVLNRLIEAGVVVSDGQTRALNYRLKPFPPHKQDVESN